uniref:Uncharacterized protein n=1 Tax=Siphoviridae sp. cthHz3 TaxID=2825614 RepID=A0A8S5UYS1_9CAUD|nr:MAG TPA: hypothetical protein [Siphoviridae sp. cthHz3]
MPPFVSFWEHLKNIISVPMCQRLFQKNIQILFFGAPIVHNRERC